METHEGISRVLKGETHLKRPLGSWNDPINDQWGLFCVIQHIPEGRYWENARILLTNNKNVKCSISEVLDCERLFSGLSIHMRSRHLKSKQSWARCWRKKNPHENVNSAKSKLRSCYQLLQFQIIFAKYSILEFIFLILFASSRVGRVSGLEKSAVCVYSATPTGPTACLFFCNQNS